MTCSRLEERFSCRLAYTNKHNDMKRPLTNNTTDMAFQREGSIFSQKQTF